MTARDEEEKLGIANGCLGVLIVAFIAIFNTPEKRWIACVLAIIATALVVFAAVSGFFYFLQLQ